MVATQPSGSMSIRTESVAEVSGEVSGSHLKVKLRLCYGGRFEQVRLRDAKACAQASAAPWCVMVLGDLCWTAPSAWGVRLDTPPLCCCCC